MATASSVVLPLFLAVVLATLFRPLVRWLERFRLPASLASGVVVVSIVSGIDTLSGFIAGVVLGILILYYMLKEGGTFLRAAEQRMLPGRADQLGYFATDAATVMRRYWLGRTIVSAVVAGVVAMAALAMGLPMVPTLAIVTFVGGYIPYIGAFIGGLLAVVVAIAEEGLGAGAR